MQTVKKILSAVIMLYEICYLVLNEDAHLMPVKEAIWDVRYKWKDIGRKLGLKSGDIQAIHEPNDGECLHVVLSQWMHTGKATLNHLLSALESKVIDCPDIAREIRSRTGEARTSVGLDESSSEANREFTDNIMLL